MPLCAPVRVAASPGTRPPPSTCSMLAPARARGAGADLPGAGPIAKEGPATNTHHCLSGCRSGTRGTRSLPRPLGKRPRWDTVESCSSSPGVAPRDQRVLPQLLPWAWSCCGSLPSCPKLLPALLTAACRAWHTPSLGLSEESRPLPQAGPQPECGGLTKCGLLGLIRSPLAVCEAQQGRAGQGRVRPTWDTQGCSSGFWISFQLAL